jgi:hypothetical protein
VKDDPLSSRPDDEIHRLARGVIGLLPLGSLLTEMFTRIVVDPAQQRRDRIIREILEKIAISKRLDASAQTDLRVVRTSLRAFFAGSRRSTERLSQRSLRLFATRLSILQSMKSWSHQFVRCCSVCSNV